MGKFATFFLWVVVLLLLALVSWGFALFMQWPTWTALAVFLGVLGCYFLVKFTIRLVQVFRSRSRMAKLSTASQGNVARQMSPRAMLLRKWSAAVATLRNSSLKRFGNPLHVLPWYMVVGKSGTGKTTALTRTRLASSIQKVSQSTPIQQTANYDWWFFDRAVVIDCAGRYVEAADLEEDRSEWELGLDLLAKYRGKEGLNGLVLAISAERLQHIERDALIDEGRVIRERIEQLIRLFGKRFPIYVLVTQCDRIYGLEQWAGQLPENALEQAMGFLAVPESGDLGQPQFLDRAFDSIAARLQALRVTLLGRSVEIAPELLLFPNELQQLKPGLEVFLKACLGDNAYLETPFLRGLFFSSGMQEGGAVSGLLGNVLPPVPQHASRNAGLFLHDFFGLVLPQDRNISLPASLRNPWRTATQNLGLLSWVLLTIAIAIFMTFSFVSNLETLRLLEQSYGFNPKFVGRLEEDAATLERIQATVALMEARDDNWRTGWMVSSTNMDDLESSLKSSYVDNFRKYILPTTDAYYKSDMERVLVSDPGNEFPGLTRNVVRYINLLRARARGAELQKLESMPQREHVVRYTPEMYTRLNGLYLANIAWSTPGDNYVALRLKFEQQLLSRLAFNDPNLTWLVGLAASNPLLRPVTVKDFWRGTAGNATEKRNPDLLVVPAAFTIEGKKFIDSFLVEMAQSIDDGPKFLTERRAFEVWYRDQRLQAWQKFVTEFSGTERTLSGEIEWRAALGLIAGLQSPYYRVVGRLNEEFSAEATDKLPGWLQLSRQLGQLQTQAIKLDAAGSAVKVVGSINTVGGKAIKEVLAGAPAQGENTIKGNLAAVAAMQQYFKEINIVATDVAGGPGKAYQAAADFHAFASDPSVKSSALQTAADNLLGLRRLVGFSGADEEAIWQLIGGPLRFVLGYTEEQASCSLQKEWEAKVNWPLQTAPDMTAMVDQLYGAKGSVWAFADGPAKPFLQRDSNRFGIVQTLGYSVPFTRQFLPMLNDAAGKRVEQLVLQQRIELEDQVQKLAAEKDQLQAQQAVAQIDRLLADIKQKTDALKAQVLQLGITAQPTSVNPGAKVKPFMTSLTIQCASGARVINNYNFPISDSFPLGERLCGDVTLQIKIEDVVLTKKYPGASGVVRFLQDFKDGSRQFNVDEFPAARPRLEALGVRQIGLRYSFDGQDAILRTNQQLETLNRQEKTELTEKQRQQDVQFSHQQRGIQTKMANVSRSSPTEVSLPKQIGVCWDNKMIAYRRQDTQAMFKELAAAQMVLPVAPSGKGLANRLMPSR